MIDVNDSANFLQNRSTFALFDVWEKKCKQLLITKGQGDPVVISLNTEKTILASVCRSGMQDFEYIRAGNADVNWLGMLIGKAQATINADFYVFNCHSKKLESLPLVISFNALGVDTGQVDRSIGAGVAAKMLEISQ